MFIAEREGFEPPVPCSTTVFKTAAFDHSAISPELLIRSAFSQMRCKGKHLFLICNSFGRKMMKNNDKIVVLFMSRMTLLSLCLTTILGIIGLDLRRLGLYFFITYR